jgi:hypothetical protein
MNTRDEFMENECIIFCVPVLPEYAEINMKRELHNMPSYIHADEDISRIDNIEQVGGHVESGCFPLFRHLILLYKDAQLFGNYHSLV